MRDYRKAAKDAREANSLSDSWRPLSLCGEFFDSKIFTMTSNVSNESGAIQQRTGWIRVSAASGILACLGNIYITYLLGTRSPEYRPYLQTMSDLGHKGSPVAPIISSWWVVMGLLFIVFGYGLYRAFLHYGKIARTAGWMVALYGIGEGLGSGLVPGSPGSVFQSPNSIVHNLMGGIGVLGAMLLPFVTIKMFHAEKSSALYRFAWFTAVSGFFFFALFSVSTFYHPPGSWISYLGLWQRLFVLMYYFFFIYLAVLMLAGKDPSAIRS